MLSISKKDGAKGSVSATQKGWEHQARPYMFTNKSPATSRLMTPPFLPWPELVSSTLPCACGSPQVEVKGLEGARLEGSPSGWGAALRLSDRGILAPGPFHLPGPPVQPLLWSSSSVRKVMWQGEKQDKQTRRTRSSALPAPHSECADLPSTFPLTSS